MSNAETRRDHGAINPVSAQAMGAFGFAALALGLFVQSADFSLARWLTGVLLAVAACSTAFGVASMISGPKYNAILGIISVFVIIAGGVFYPDPTPRGPTDITPTASTGSVRITWQFSADDPKIKEYQVYRDGKPVCLGRMNECIDNKELPSGRHEYYVIAIGDNGRVSRRYTFSVDVPGVSLTLKPPVALTPGAVEAHSVQLSWSAGEGETPGGYTIARDTVPVGVSTSTTFTDTDVTPGSKYSYTVRATNRERTQESADSEPVVVLTPAADGSSPAPAPTGGKPVAGPDSPTNLRLTASTQTSITLAWTAARAGSNPIAGYRVYRDGSLRRTVNASTQSLQDTGLNPGTGYRYSLRAYDTAGRESAPTAQVAMSTAPAPPSTETFGTKTIDLIGNQGVLFNNGGAQKQDGGGDYIFVPGWPKVDYWAQSITTDRTYENCLTKVGQGQWDEIKDDDLVAGALSCSRLIGTTTVAYVQILATDFQASPRTLKVKVWFVRPA